MGREREGKSSFLDALAAGARLVPSQPWPFAGMPGRAQLARTDGVDIVSINAPLITPPGHDARAGAGRGEPAEASKQDEAVAGETQRERPPTVRFMCWDFAGQTVRALRRAALLSVGVAR